MLNDMLQGRQANNSAFVSPIKVKKPPEDKEDIPGVSGLSAAEPMAKQKPDTPVQEEDSMSSGASDSTVLYNMESSNCEDKKSNKKDFFESDHDTSSTDSNGETSERGRRRKKKSRKEKRKRERESEDAGDSEEKELQKLLRMTDIPVTRPQSSESEENEDKEETEKKKEGEEKKASKAKEDEVSLMDCLNMEDGADIPNSGSGNDVEEATGGDFFSTINSQVKKTFLLSSDESCNSSEENEAKPEEESNEKEEDKQDEKDELEKKKRKPESKSTEKKRKDDLREFRVPNLDEDSSEEEEKEEELTEKDSSKKEDEGSSEDSDDSVKYVQSVEKKKRRTTINSDSDLETQQSSGKSESSPTKGRKNIKKILKKEHLQVETQQALKMETERKKRVREREKLFEKLFPSTGEDSKFILDFDPDTKEELMVVNEKLAGQLKPHQKDGVRFMWNSCFESLKRLEEDSGSGCILAHCMGLGKTLQVITLVHTILTHNTGVQTVLIICPLNTIRNWIHEFKTWLKDCKKKIKPFDLIPCRTKHSRIATLKFWSKQGGVLVISYEMFRCLIKNDNKNQLFSQRLLDPGPDLVVCDEGHVLKNSKSALSKCISRIKTLRRIILTGTPLQNNLSEYYCMVQFVKPNILGTSKEFKNRFVNPINNGQFEDSTEYDVCLMKRRAHVLHTMLEGFVQRFGYYVLTPFLPEKQEFVISIALTENQERIYRVFIDQCSQDSRGLLKDFHWLQKVWTHPRVMLIHSEKNNIEESRRMLWSQYFKKEDYDDIWSSGKLLLLFQILRRCKEIGDKVLVFSQSLYNLDLIEYFLKKGNNDHINNVQTEFADSWVLGEDYFRLDGSTKSENRDVYCQKFNKVEDKRFRLFLVSTRAGGLGISLVAANRVVMFDASWNPTHDVQSIFRVYRFGQKKPCFIYRFLAAATMEEKIYRRQVTKLSLAHRILDEHQIERHYTMGNLQELYTYDPIPKTEWKIPIIPKDNLFAEILVNWRDIIVGYHEHDSLLENKEEEVLTEEERRAAWEDFEKEKLTPEFPQTFNGNIIPSSVWENLNREGLSLIPRYQPNIKMGGPPNSGPHQKENQMCKIVDVRTLHDLKNLEPRRLVDLGNSFGMNPFRNESLDDYCMRVDDTLKNIFPQGFQ